MRLTFYERSEVKCQSRTDPDRAASREFLGESYRLQVTGFRVKGGSGFPGLFLDKIIVSYLCIEKLISDASSVVH